MSAARQYFLTCDDRYIKPLSVVVYSILKNANPERETRIYVACNGKFLTTGCCAALNRIVDGFPFAKAIFLNADQLLTEHRAVLESARNKWSPIIWAGPLISLLLPESAHGRVLYLDVDMLVNEDLSPLFDVALGDRLVGAAVAEGERCRFRDMEKLEWPAEARCYYNNGTLLLDIDRYRALHIPEKIIAWYSKYREVALRADQDAQNAVFGHLLLPLPLKWNFNNALYYRIVMRHPFVCSCRTHDGRSVLEAIAHPAIIHYMNRKPWTFSNRPTDEQYHRYMKELGLFSEDLTGKDIFAKLSFRMHRLVYAGVRGFAEMRLRGILRREKGGREAHALYARRMAPDN